MGRATLVTGASTGIGHSTALLLARSGFTVRRGPRPGDHVQPSGLEINLVGQVAVIQAFLPKLRAAKGRLVNVTSVAGRIAVPFQGAYSASKFGLEAISDTLRSELAADGISVSVVEPGAIATAMPGKFAADAARIKDTWPTTSRYGRAFDAFARTLTSRTGHGSRPEVVARAITHALTAKQPKIRYAVGESAKRMTTIAKLVPARQLDRVLARFFETR